MPNTKSTRTGQSGGDTWQSAPGQTDKWDPHVSMEIKENQTKSANQKMTRGRQCQVSLTSGTHMSEEKEEIRFRTGSRIEFWA